MDLSHIILRGSYSNTRTRGMKRLLENSQAASLQVGSPSRLRQSTSEREDITQVTKNTNDERMHETEPISREMVNIYEANCTSQTELPVGLTFVTPQKKKLPDITDTEDFAELLKTGIKVIPNPRRNTLSSSSKSAPIDFGKNSKCAASDSAQVSGSSRKRARKGRTTLKQMAEKDELERKEKMGNFVIPFFIQ
ncbi:hypothetical protein HU200_021910 [Digitaria exilis]|uniref:Uncharacterized protein n=1 Tax=Digitaria exilis TaxID=1010633 RepID=A0A835EY33_9POAL|nr:hypothetical protein HU200_021910 [Digitaria exilis]